MFPFEPKTKFRSVDDFSFIYFSSKPLFHRLLAQLFPAKWDNDSIDSTNSLTKEFDNWGLLFTEATSIVDSSDYTHYLNRKNVITKLSHEVKTPCIAISDLIESLISEKGHINSYLSPKKEQKQDNSAIQRLRQIRVLSDYISIVIHEMNDFSSKYSQISYDFQLINLKEIATWTHDYLKTLLYCYNRNSIETTLSIDESAELLDVKIDLQKMKIIMIEIIKNSVINTLEGSIEIRLDFHKKVEKKTSISNFQISKPITDETDVPESQKSLVLSIFDSGRGIDKYKINKLTRGEIAKDFVKFGNMGIGLKMVEKYSKDMKITVDIFSTQNRGCTTLLTFQNHYKHKKLRSFCRFTLSNSDNRMQSELKRSESLEQMSISTSRNQRIMGSLNTTTCKLSKNLNFHPYHMSPQVSFSNQEKKSGYEIKVDSYNSITDNNIYEPNSQTKISTIFSKLKKHSSKKLSIRTFNNSIYSDISNYSADMDEQNDIKVHSKFPIKYAHNNIKHVNNPKKTKIQAFNIDSSCSSDNENIESTISKFGIHKHQNPNGLPSEKFVSLKSSIMKLLSSNLSVSESAEELKQILKKISAKSAFNADVWNEAIFSTQESFSIISKKIEDATDIIIIIDDDYFCRKSLEKVIHSSLKKFRIADYKIISLKDGCELISVVIDLHIKSKISCLKLIISDENMTYLNGSDSLRVVEAILFKISIRPISSVIITAIEEAEALRELQLKAKCMTVLKKPVSSASLVSIFEKVKLIK